MSEFVDGIKALLSKITKDETQYTTLKFDILNFKQAALFYKAGSQK